MSVRQQRGDQHEASVLQYGWRNAICLLGSSAGYQSFSMVGEMQYVCEAAVQGISPSVWLEECNISARQQREASVLQYG